jgi:hypothetical protein
MSDRQGSKRSGRERSRPSGIELLEGINPVRDVGQGRTVCITMGSPHELVDCAVALFEGVQGDLVDYEYIGGLFRIGQR